MELDAPSQKKVHSKNLLEWLSGRSFPDSSLTLVVGLLAALSLAPYLGGTTLSFVGENAVAIPTISAASFWTLVFVTPICWYMLVVRIIGARPKRVVLTLLCAVCLSLLSIAGHKLYPTVALSSITPEFDETYRLDFLTNQRTWRAAHEVGSDRYCHFVTAAIPLGDQFAPGCAARIDAIRIQASGSATISATAAFDLEAYISTKPLLPETDECLPAQEWQAVKTQPDNSEIVARSVIEVPKSSVETTNQLQYALEYDFVSKSASARPTLAFVKQYHRKDIYVTQDSPTLQLSGWTLWGAPASFDLTAISVRLTGRLQCGFWL